MSTKKKVLVLGVVLFAISLTACGGKGNTDNRSDIEKFADQKYSEVKDEMRQNNELNKNEEAKVDKAYNDVKNAAKSIGDLLK